MDDVTFFNVYFCVGVDRLVDEGPVFLENSTPKFE
jgi:hypothetical protein